MYDHLYKTRLDVRSFYRNRRRRQWKKRRPLRIWVGDESAKKGLNQVVDACGFRPQPHNQLKTLPASAFDFALIIFTFTMVILKLQFILFILYIKYGFSIDLMDDDKEPTPEPEPQSIRLPELEPKSGVQENPVPTATEIGKDTQILANQNKRISFDHLISEDYGDAMVEQSSKPDDVDNEAIQQLVDRFLNKGTLEEDKKTKVNKDIQALINSSNYWHLENLKPESSIASLADAQAWLNGYSQEAQKILHQVSLAAWGYFTAVSPLTKQNLDEAEEALRLFLKATSHQAKQFNVNSLDNGIVGRQLELIMIEGMNALSDEDFSSYVKVQEKINKIFTTTIFCEHEKQTTCILKFADILPIVTTNNDPQQALNLWKNWRKSIGSNMTSTFDQLVKMINQAAKLNGFENAGQMWRNPYDLSSKTHKMEINLMAELDRVYAQIKPFYTQLHAYFRRQLAAVYKNADGITKDGPIPIHLLRSSNGETWINHYEETKPFDLEDGIPEEILSSFHKQNYTTKSMFILAYRYMKHFGFEKLPPTFWTKSVFARNWSKDMICHPTTAYDMMDGQDYRVKACAQLGEYDFVSAHKLLAELYYKYLPRAEPILLRDAPNPSLRKAVANIFGILALNPEYLKSHKLIDENSSREEAQRINHLYHEALESFVKLPFDIVADTWRFQVFEEKIDSQNWSELWWKLREKYQGIKAPPGVEESSYDPVASPAVVQQLSPATQHFVEYVIQFQILKTLCNSDPKHLDEGCMPKEPEIKRLIETMKQGSSITWIQALEQITGSKTLDATALIEYYQPLIDWLQNTNERDQVYKGWEGSGERFTQEEIPVLRSEQTGLREHFPSGDQIAFPGQTCLLDSNCNGTICVCNEGLYTLQIADTYNCVPGNPADAGFINKDNGGVVIGLYPDESDNSTFVYEEKATTGVPPVRSHASIRYKPIMFFIYLFISCIVFYL